MTKLKAAFKAATDENYHTEATMIIAREIPGKLGEAYVTILEEIEFRHELNGHMEYNDARLRDAIQDDALSIVKAMGKF